MRSMTGFTAILILVAGFLALTVLPACAGDSVTVEVSRIPLVFIENQGQRPAEVLYHTSAAGHSIYFTKDAVVCVRAAGEDQAASVIEITVAGQGPGTEVTGEDPLTGTANFLIGNDPGQWVTSVPTFGKVRYAGILPGVDIIYYGTQGALKRDIALAPGTDPAGVVIRYSGQEGLSIGEDGSLMVESAVGTLREAPPVCYQVIDGMQVPVDCDYVILDESDVGFSVGPYDPAYSLIIDPFLDFSTYLGGKWEDKAYAVAVDELGSAYVTGGTRSNDFPVPADMPAPFQEFNAGNLDVFVTKFEPSGTVLNYTTYIGGYNDDCGHGIAVNSSGYAYVTGYTLSHNFPVLNEFQTNKSGGGYCYPCADADAFITVLYPWGNGALYSSYLGGNMSDIGQAIALDSTDSPVLTGYTGSWDFPNQSALFPTINGTLDAFVTGISFDGTLSSIAFSTFLGGAGADRGYGIAMGSNDDIYVTGMTRSPDFPTANPYRANLRGDQDAFVTHFLSGVTGLSSSTYLGGRDNEAGYGIAVDDNGYIYVTGFTTSTLEFPIKNAFQNFIYGPQDAFLTKFEPAGNLLNFSTYIGGSQVDEGTGIAIDGSGSIFITGFTDSWNYPTKNAIYGSLNGWPYDAFVTRFYPNGTALMFSTYLGGKLEDRAMGIALNGANATVAGFTMSPDFPVKNAVQPNFNMVYDAFVARIASIPPVANFTAEANGVENYTLIKGLPPLLVNFTDLSTGEPTAWEWLFGDNTTSTLQHPNHTYTTGNYTVNLTVSNLEGTNSTSKPFYIDVGVPLIVDFFAANVSDVNCTFCQGQIPFFVNFTDITNDTPLTWNWSFGDGNFSPDQHTNWTYNITGLYNVSLNVTNDYGFNSTTKYFLVEAGDVPIANFTNATPRFGVVPLNVIFTDLSFGIPNITAWNWSFDNTTAVEWFNTTVPAQRNANHTFLAKGNYTVNLTVFNLYGNDTMSKTDFIRVGELPVANFTADNTNVIEGDLVNFTDWSTGYPEWWQWSFGDGTILDRTQNTTMMPVNHTYNNSGNFTVALTVGNEYGTNTLTRSRYIQVSGNVFYTNLYFVPSSFLIPTNSTTQVRLEAEKFDQGLGIYNITVYFADPAAAKFVEMNPPSWADPTWTRNSTVPGSSVWLRVADVPDAIKPGATNVTLATFNATGYVPGSTTINVTVELMQADTEDNIQTQSTPADVEIVLLQQFPPTEDWPIYGPPTAPYHDGVYWDLNGSGDIDFVDVVLFFLLFDNWMSEPGQPIALFDYNGNGWLGFDDLVLLFLEVP